MTKSIVTDKLGEIKNNAKGTPMKIVAYRGNDDIDVMFQDKHYYIKEHQTYSNFKSGAIKNPYDKTVFGIGYLGVGRHKMQYQDTKTNTRTYMSWKNMLDRCYGEQNKKLHPAYFEISTVCSEWLNFQIFADWYEEREYKVEGRLHLDKDIKYPGNTVYSPQTCILVPQRINMLFMNKPNKRGLPNGIVRCKSGYLAKYNHENLGIYTTVEGAYKVYANKKEATIKQIADEYKNIIPEKVYKALYDYKFDIRNDRNYIC